jgi:hypothetical protein
MAGITNCTLSFVFRRRAAPALTCAVLKVACDDIQRSPKPAEVGAHG